MAVAVVVRVHASGDVVQPPWTCWELQWDWTCQVYERLGHAEPPEVLDLVVDVVVGMVERLCCVEVVHPDSLRKESGFGVVVVVLALPWVVDRHNCRSCIARWLPRVVTGE